MVYEWMSEVEATHNLYLEILHASNWHWSANEGWVLKLPFQDDNKGRNTSIMF
ncbi:MAG: hypothetical protein RLZZ29_677 [Cyanobacteriota bacterium]|jgi:hypothetical protein